MIDLDQQATTPLAPEALAAMRPWLEEGHGNPHSAHAGGRAAAAAVAVARDRIAALMPPGGSVSFTSGATEALNWALKGAPVTSTRNRIVTLATEHAAVLDTVAALGRRGQPVTVLPVKADGLVDLADIDAVLGEDVALVAAMLVNNEIGVVQPITEIAALAHAAGALMLTDAVQGFGRLPIPEGPDLVAVSAHKIHGPKGVGALWIRDGVALEPLLHGGGQETAGRSGTLSPALCAGFGAAAALAAGRMTGDRAHCAELFDVALALLEPRGWVLNGSRERRWPGNLNIRRPGLDVARLMSDLRDILFSAGSACASGSGLPSHVLRAIGLSDAEARSSIRLGFGGTTERAAFLDAVGRIADAAEAQDRAAA